MFVTTQNPTLLFVMPHQTISPHMNITLTPCLQHLKPTLTLTTCLGCVTLALTPVFVGCSCVLNPSCMFMISHPNLTPSTNPNLQICTQMFVAPPNPNLVFLMPHHTLPVVHIWLNPSHMFGMSPDPNPNHKFGASHPNPNPFLCWDKAMC